MNDYEFYILYLPIPSNLPVKVCAQSSYTASCWQLQTITATDRQTDRTHGADVMMVSSENSDLHSLPKHQYV